MQDGGAGFVVIEIESGDVAAVGDGDGIIIRQRGCGFDIAGGGDFRDDVGAGREIGEGILSVGAGGEGCDGSTVGGESVAGDVVIDGSADDVGLGDDFAEVVIQSGLIFSDGDGADDADGSSGPRMPAERRAGAGPPA